MTGAAMDSQNSVEIFFEDKPVIALAGESVAAALLRAGVAYTGKHAVAHDHRAPFCMMGVCFECLMRIDGVDNRQACLTTVRNGMRVERQMPEGESA